jgi:hypothetical protein
MDPMVCKSRKSLSVRKNSSSLETRRDSWPQANAYYSWFPVQRIHAVFVLHHIPEHVSALPTPVMIYAS